MGRILPFGGPGGLVRACCSESLAPNTESRLRKRRDDETTANAGRVLARRKVGLGSGGLKGPFVDSESVDEGTWLEGKQGPWFLRVCPHLSPPSSLWDRGGGMGDAVTMGSCWAWGRALASGRSAGLSLWQRFHEALRKRMLNPLA